MEYVWTAKMEEAHQRRVAMLREIERRYWRRYQARINEKLIAMGVPCAELCELDEASCDEFVAPDLAAWGIYDEG